MPSHRGLEVEAKEWDDFRNPAAVGEQIVLARLAKRSEAEQPCVEAEFASERSFSERLL